MTLRSKWSLAITAQLLALLALLAGCNQGTPPAAEFSASPTQGPRPLAVTFTDASTGSPALWHWEFGDGDTSAEQNPSHTYQASGTYDVMLVVTNHWGRDTLAKTAYITVTDTSTIPTADFTAEPVTGVRPLTVNFTDLSLGNPTGWSWDFGDANSSTDQNPSHIYADSGIYSVTLIITSANGSDTMTRTDYITVTDSVPALVYDSLTASSFKFKWATDGALLRCTLSAPTTGWVSVGFNPTVMKKDANLIIGYFKQGTAYIQDNWGTSQTAHASDVSLGGTDDVTDISGSETTGRTEISFAIPLDSGDPYDRVLVPGNSYRVIFAYGPNGADNYTSEHVATASSNITIR